MGLQPSAAVARDMSGAASHFSLNQLQELMEACSAIPTNFPVQYLGPTCRKRGRRERRSCYCRRCWATARCAAWQNVRRSSLPDWLPDITLTDLRLGRRQFDIRFWRDGHKTKWEVLRGNHDAIVSATTPVKIVCIRMLTPLGRPTLTRGYCVTPGGACPQH